MVNDGPVEDVEVHDYHTTFQVNFNNGTGMLGMVTPNTEVKLF
jgi:hypothetical protein